MLLAHCSRAPYSAFASLAGDYTDRYWAVMSKIQQEIVPILERLRGMIGASNKLGVESEKVASKLNEILSLLPRLKVSKLQQSSSTVFQYMTAIIWLMIACARLRYSRAIRSTLAGSGRSENSSIWRKLQSSWDLTASDLLLRYAFNRLSP